MDENPYRSPAEVDGPKRPKLKKGWPTVVFFGLCSLAYSIFGGVLLAGAVSGGFKFAPGRSAVSNGALGILAVMVSAMFFFWAKRLA